MTTTGRPSQSLRATTCRDRNTCTKDVGGRMADGAAVARAPSGLGPRGRRLWRQVLAGYELSDAEAAVLLEACRTADLVDRLHEQLGAEPLTVEGSRGQPAVHPIAAELRQQRDLLGRLLGRLALPDDDTDDTAAASKFGRRGAAARWHRRSSGS